MTRLDGFGTKDGDICFVAETDGVIVGAVWVRIMDDYGHVDDETPSFAGCNDKIRCFFCRYLRIEHKVDIYHGLTLVKRESI